MNNPIHALVLTLALSGTGVPALAQDDAAPAAETAPAESAPAETAPADTAPAETRERGVSVVVDVDNDGEDDGAGAIGRALGTGLAAILEEHVLVRDDLSEEDREEVQEAIAELRGEIRQEAREVASEVRTDVQNEVREASKEIAAAARDSVKSKPRVVIKGGPDSGDDFGLFTAVVASLAIVFTLGMPILIVALILYSGYRRRRLAHETINQFVSSGKEIPPEIMQNLFKDAGAAQAPRTNLHKGSVNTGIGLGMVVGFSAIDIEFLAAIGFIFLLVGLAQLLIWKLEKGKKSEVGPAQG